MDAADVSPSDGVMIALLPTSSDWTKLDLPHLTLVYAGAKTDLKPTDFNNLAKDAASLAALSNTIRLTVVGPEPFGPPGDQVNAFRLNPTTQLWAMRRFVEKWNKSEYPFSPHVTIGPLNPAQSISPSYVQEVPYSIAFDRVYLGWGDDSLTFYMNSGGMY